MKYINLTSNKKTLIDDSSNADNFHWWFDGKYAARKYKNKKIYLHRYITKCPVDMEVDHINGDKLDNRLENLRICTHEKNNINRSIGKNNTSGHKGISWDKRNKKWYVYIHIDRKMINLGKYSNKDIAIKIRKKAEIKYFGEYSSL